MSSSSRGGRTSSFVASFSRATPNFWRAGAKVGRTSAQTKLITFSFLDARLGSGLGLLVEGRKGARNP